MGNASFSQLTSVPIEKSNWAVWQNPLSNTMMLASKFNCTGMKWHFSNWLCLLLLPPSQNACLFLNHFSFQCKLIFLAGLSWYTKPRDREVAMQCKHTDSLPVLLQKQQPSAEKTAPTVLKCHPKTVVRQNYQSNAKPWHQYLILNRKPFLFLFPKELTQSFNMQNFTQL